MSIRVDEQVISDHEVHLELQYHPAPSFEEARDEAQRALVVRALLVQEATRRGLLESLGKDADAEEAAIRALTEAEVPVPEVTEAECRAHVARHRDRFRGPDLFAPSHILFAARPDDIEGRISARTQAIETIAELAVHPQRFERIARERSGCPSGAGGGSLGQLQRGESLGEFERALRSTPPGTLCPDPIETEHGFHVLRLDARAEGEPVPFEAVAERVRIYLRDSRWRRAMQHFIAGLAGAADIEGYSLSSN